MGEQAIAQTLWELERLPVTLLAEVEELSHSSPPEGA